MIDTTELRRLAEAACALEPLDDYEIDRACDGVGTAYARTMRPFLRLVSCPTTILTLLGEIAVARAALRQIADADGDAEDVAWCQNVAFDALEAIGGFGND